jgi:hypothetical protein
MLNMILATVCAAAMLVPGMASAQVTGTLGGGYTRITDGGGADLYGLNGSLATALGQDWNLEGSASWHRAEPGSADLWTAGGNLFLKTGFGRIAAGAIHGGLQAGHTTSYGAGADWFYSDAITLSLKGGGYYTGAPRSENGYVGLQGIYYVQPNLALSATFDYAGVTTGGDINSQKIKAEWQFSDTLPLSVYGGYQRYESAGADLNAIFVGFKFYLDGASNLAGHHRTGSLGYIGQSLFQVGSY